MPNVSHASLTGSNLHEPKGAAAAANGTVYVANGAGSGTWQSVGTSAFTGMIADFAAPVAPTGWLELDGSTVSTTTFSALYSVMSISTSGTRSNGSPTVTSIPDTSTFKVGYFVFGTGITSGTTVLSIDSGTQITLSANATSGGSSTFVVSPWLLNTGTIKLPDFTTNGRFRRSRTSTTAVGQVQTSQNLAHTHGSPLTSGNNSVDHTHNFSGSGAISASTVSGGLGQFVLGSGTISAGLAGAGGGTVPTTTGTFAGSASATTTGTASVSGTTGGASATHTHSVTIPSDGGTEARPLTMIVLTCVKT